MILFFGLAVLLYVLDMSLSSEEGFAQVKECLTSPLVKLVLSKYRGEEVDLQRVVARLVSVKEQPCLCFVYSYKTRDITKNLPLREALQLIGEWLPAAFKNAHLLSLTEELQLTFSKKDKPQLFAGNALPREAPRPQSHFGRAPPPSLDARYRHELSMGVNRASLG